jgi:carboxyl-terminal processing protease
VTRILAGVVLALAAAACSACSAKGPNPTDSRRANTELASAPKPVAPPSTPQGASVPAPDPREAALAEAVGRLLSSEHLLHKQIDDQVSRDAFTTYMKRIDPTKMFLLKADRDALAKHTDKIDDELRDGTFALAHEGAHAYVARVAVVEKFVNELLAAPLNHDDEESIELDPDKFELAANDQELRERWRRRLELEVMERVSGMEARLDAAAKAKKDAAKKPDPKAKKDPKKDAAKKDGSGSGSGSDAADDDDVADKSPLAQIPPTFEGREAKARADLAKAYGGRFARLKNPEPLDAAADVINSVASVLDPHTTYLPPADKANFDIRMSGSLEGIGAVLRERDHYIEVVELVPGGAAWRQGSLAVGDLIMSVQGPGQDAVDVVDMRIDEVVKMIRGPKGTIVKLHVQKPAGNEETIAITRDVVVIEESYAKAALVSEKGTPTYGYIFLPSFYGGRGSPRSSGADVRRLLAEMKKQKAAGVILDIRGNGGGLLGDAIEMTGGLIDKGPVVQVQDARGKREVLTDDKRGTDYDGVVIVLVDRFSASASEILAGALQDYKRAIIVGTGPTHGKGTVQTLADLDRLTGGKAELGVLKLTIQQFFRVSGASTQREGVTPDIVLPDPNGYVESGEASLDHAIAWSQISPAQHDNWPATYKMPVLVQKSAARMAKHPLLTKIAATNELLRARKKDTKVPLSRTAYETRRKEQKAALDAVSPDLKNAAVKLQVKPIEEPSAAAPPAPTGKADDRSAKWRDAVARDPWIEECVNILVDAK